MPSVSRYAQIHGIGTPQTFGAVAAASKLLQLDRDQILNALGIAGATAPVAHAGKFGWTDKGISFVKDNAAVPAEIGLRAALLAQAGYQGSESILDGETGFWLMAGSDRCDFDQLQDFSRYRILEVSLKPYPCCRWLHTTLDVLRELRENRGFHAADVERVVVRSIPALAGQFQRRMPYNFIDVQFSVPLSVSLLLLDADLTSWWRLENHCRPEVLELAARVEVYSSDEFQSRFEALGRRSACIPARVEVILKNGARLDGYAEEASGLPSKPMSGQERLMKFNELTRPFLSQKRRDRLKKEIQSLNESSKINQLSDIMMGVK